MVVDIGDAKSGPVKTVGCPIKLSRTNSKVASLAPHLGEHTREVLLESGLDEKEIDDLAAGGADTLRQLTSCKHELRRAALRPPRIIDAHHHLWDLERVYYPWLTDEIEPDFLFGEYAKIRKNYLPEDMRRQMRGWNIEMTVHVEAERADGEQVKETAWLSEMHERFRLPNAIIGHVWLADPNVEELLRQHMQYPLFRGVRSKPRTGKTAREANLTGPATMSDPQWRSGLEAAGDARTDL